MSPRQVEPDGVAGQPAGPRLLTVRSVADAFEDPPKEPPELVRGLLRPGELAGVASVRGVGKTWLGYNTADLVGRGEGKLCGVFDVQGQARVLYCQGELDDWGAYDRWRRLAAEGKPPPGVDETFDRWRIRVRRRRVATSSMDSHEFMEAVLDSRLEATIRDGGYALLIIDPWRTYFAGPENDNDATEAALDLLRDLALRYGLAVMILAHVRKSQEAREPEDLWRGAGRLADAVATRMTLLPHYTEAQAEKQGMTRQQARRYVDVYMLRRGAPAEDFSAKWNPETGWWERWRPPGRPPTAGEPKSRTRARPGGRPPRPSYTPEEVAQLCRAGSGAWGSIRKAAEALGVSQDTARDLLRQACEAGFLEEVRLGRRARGYITVDGRLPGV
jgi:AAA domain